MKIVVLVAILGASAPVVAAGQTASSGAASDGRADRPAPDTHRRGLRAVPAAHVFADAGNTDGAIAAYKRAMALDPTAADNPGRTRRALHAARTARPKPCRSRAGAQDRARQQAGASRARSGLRRDSPATPGHARRSRARSRRTSPKAIEHLEKALETPVTSADITSRALLGAALRRRAAIRQSDPAAARPREGSAVLARRPVAADGSVRGRRPDGRSRQVARGVGARQPAAVRDARRASTRASAAGPMRRPRTSRR